MTKGKSTKKNKNGNSKNIKENKNVKTNISKQKKVQNESTTKDLSKKLKNKSVDNAVSLKQLEEKKKTVEKARRNLHFEKSNDADEFSKLIKIVLLVTVIMIVFYFVTTIVTRKANAIKTVKNLKTNEKAKIQYDSLIIGSMLKMDGSYYVLIENEDDEKISEYKTLMQTIEANDEAPKIYTASLDNSFNNFYLNDESNYDSNLENFRVRGTTLVKINNHKIEKTFDSYDDILNELNSLK